MEEEPQRYEEADCENDSRGREDKPQSRTFCSGLPEPIARQEAQRTQEDEHRPQDRHRGRAEGLERAALHRAEPEKHRACPIKGSVDHGIQDCQAPDSGDEKAHRRRCN